MAASVNKGDPNPDLKWQWFDSSKKLWVSYDSATTKRIESHYNRWEQDNDNQSTVSFEIRKVRQRYEISFTHWNQTNVSTKKTRKVRRIKGIVQWKNLDRKADHKTFSITDFEGNWKINQLSISMKIENDYVKQQNEIPFESYKIEWFDPESLDELYSQRTCPYKGWYIEHESGYTMARYILDVEHSTSDKLKFVCVWQEARQNDYWPEEPGWCYEDSNIVLMRI